MLGEIKTTLVVTDGGYLHGALAPGHRNRFEAPIATQSPPARARRRRAGLPGGGQARHRYRRDLRERCRFDGSGGPGRRGAADAYMNRQYLDPIFLGRIPRSVGGVRGGPGPNGRTRISRSSGNPSTSSESLLPRANVTRPIRRLAPRAGGCARRGRRTRDRVGGVRSRVTDTSSGSRSGMGNPPMYVTRYGAAFSIARGRGGTSRDPLRSTTSARHRGGSGRALEAGADVRGYFVGRCSTTSSGSLGYSKRFGMCTSTSKPEAHAQGQRPLLLKVIASKGQLM